MTILWTILLVIFIFLCIILIFLVLIQPHHDEGLASAFGGSGVDTFFGTRTVSIAGKWTIIIASIILVLAILLNKIPQWF